MKHLSRFVLFSTVLTPVFASAAVPNLGVITPYSDAITDGINDILFPVLIAVAFIVFLYSIYKYFILGADNDVERTKGKEFALWSVIGFVIIFSVWGLVALVGDTLGLSPGGSSPNPPTINTR